MTAPNIPANMPPQLVEALKEAEVNVAVRLARWGLYEEGNCLPAAAVTAWTFRRRGFEACVQAGAAFWRRVADPREEFPMHGYAYAPDTRFSVDLMRRGGMPEYHAWAAVPGYPVGQHPERNPDPEGDGEWGKCQDGWLVDFAARWFPDHAAKFGKTWDAPKPPHPFVIACGAPLENQAHFYYAQIEAVRLAGLATRRCLCKLMRDGFADADDLFDAVGGPRKPEGRYLDYSEAVPSYGTFLLILRRMEEERTGVKHVKHSTSVGCVPEEYE